MLNPHYIHDPVVSVNAFHEKAGRSQVGSFVFSLDKGFFSRRGAAIIPGSGSSPVPPPTKGAKPMASMPGPQPTSSKVSDCTEKAPSSDFTSSSKMQGLGVS
jgi:hypothetical protein